MRKEEWDGRTRMKAARCFSGIWGLFWWIGGKDWGLFLSSCDLSILHPMLQHAVFCGVSSTCRLAINPTGTKLLQVQYTTDIKEAREKASKERHN